MPALIFVVTLLLFNSINIASAEVHNSRLDNDTTPTIINKLYNTADLTQINVKLKFFSSIEIAHPIKYFQIGSTADFLVAKSDENTMSISINPKSNRFSSTNLEVVDLKNNHYFFLLNRVKDNQKPTMHVKIAQPEPSLMDAKQIEKLKKLKFKVYARSPKGGGKKLNQVKYIVPKAIYYDGKNMYIETSTHIYPAVTQVIGKVDTPVQSYRRGKFLIVKNYMNLFSMRFQNYILCILVRKS